MSAYTAPSTRQKHRQNGTSSPTLRGSTTAAADTQHSTTAGPTKSTTITSSQPWQHKRNQQLRCPKTPQQPTISFARHVGQQPTFYNQIDAQHGTRYADLTQEPAWVFGDGMSYTTVEYSDLHIADASLGLEDEVCASVT